METIECISSRASIRSFKTDDIPENVLKAVIGAAVQAPSAGNVQDWEFIIVRNSETKRLLSEAAFGQDFISKAPVVIVICSDLKSISSAYGERGKNLYSIQDTAAAAQNMMLAACDLGLGTCWVGAFDEEMVRKILSIPSHIRPLVIIPIGYPAYKPKKPKRKGIDKVVHKEKY
ncbi:MAG: nitroreductase family protein [Candidatus Aenigmatarchaeota archaeon]